MKKKKNFLNLMISVSEEEQEVAIEMTVEQVSQILDKPLKEMVIGRTVMWYYKDKLITFKAGKVVKVSKRENLLDA